jgi:branched-chain amino acid transport system substrate-binding protein
LEPVRLRALLLLSLLVLGACALNQQPAPTIVIGAIYPLSGPQAGGGRQELDGLRTALELARAKGVGRAGEVQLQVIDAPTPDTAVAAVDRLIDDYHATAIAGTYGSTIAVAAAAEADRRHELYWETGAVADEEVLNRSWVFRTVATGSTLGRMAVDFTVHTLLPRDGLTAADVRPVIVEEDDVYGQSVAGGETDEAAALGITDVQRVTYNAHTVDAGAVAEQIAALHPDYVWDVSYVDDAVAIWRELAAHGVHVRGAVGTSSAFCTPEFGQRMGSLAVGLYAADKPNGNVPAAALTPAAQALLAEARTRYQALDHGAMEIAGMAGFVGGWALFDYALPNVKGSVTSSSLRTAARAIDVPTGGAVNGGGIKFAPPGAVDAGQNRRAAAVVGEWQPGPAGGPAVMMRWLYPAAFAGAPDAG